MLGAASESAYVRCGPAVVESESIPSRWMAGDVSVIRGRQTRAVRWGSGADLFLLICYVRDLCVKTFQHRRCSIASFVDRLEVCCYDFLEIRDLILLSLLTISGFCSLQGEHCLQIRNFTLEF